MKNEMFHKNDKFSEKTNEKKHFGLDFVSGKLE